MLQIKCLLTTGTVLDVFKYKMCKIKLNVFYSKTVLPTRLLFPDEEAQRALYKPKRELLSTTNSTATLPSATSMSRFHSRPLITYHPCSSNDIQSSTEVSKQGLKIKFRSIVRVKFCHTITLL
jgi:hypothetical protein